MSRWLLALLLAGAVWFAVDRWWGVGVPVAAVEGDSGRGPPDAGHQPARQAITVEPLQMEPLQVERAPAEDPALAKWLEVAKSGDGAACARLWAALPDLDLALHARVLEALDARLAAASPLEAVAVLGRNNSFLHSEAGRVRARRVVERAVLLPSKSTIAVLNPLLEACMRGPIDHSQTAMRAAVDELWDAMQPALLQTVLNPADHTRARTYEVKPGDYLARIARKFRSEGIKVASGTIAAFNRISDPRRLRAGQVLKIPIEPIRTVIEKPSFLMAVYVGDTIFRLYWVGHGKDGCTPETTFTISVKEKHPDWYADGRVIPYGHPDNVLGDYFVKFSHPSFIGFGAHGTSQPGTIGTMASEGCVRMHDADIEDYFAIIPRGTEVEIRATR